MWSGALFGSVCLSLVIACSDDSPPTDQSQPGVGVWDTRAPLLTARQEMPSALLGGRIYTPGGYDAQGATVATLEIYDIAADAWTNGPSMPEGRNHPGVTVARGLVFVTGGYTSAGPASAGVFAFDPQSQAWTSRRGMPAPRAAHVAVEYGGKIYAIGGVSTSGVVGTNEVYDPSTDTWSPLAPM